MNRPLRIGEVGEKVGLTPKTIRYYEEIGLLPKPRRSEVIHGKATLRPRQGDCCVFCSYGSVKCPSKQEVSFR